MELHLEHLNQRLKCALWNMGSNVTDSSVKFAAESVDVINHVCHVFEEQAAQRKVILINMPVLHLTRT